MPNELDKGEMEMMTALLQFKKKHGADAYCALLRKFNAQRYSEIPHNEYGKVVMQCHAGVAGLNLEAAEEVEDDTPSVADRLNELAAKIYGTKRENDFAKIAAEAPNIKAAFDGYAKAVHARINAKATAKAE